MKGKRFFAKALLTLFAVLFSVTGARAQQALPYEYGFENNDLAAEGWTIVDGAGSTGIKSAAVQNGTYGFQFYYNTNPPQYLISPELTGTDKGVDVVFSYRNGGNYVETFKVGYSTTTQEADAFTWDEEITAPKNWTQYENTFPVGTKYVAVAYTANDQLRLYLDDFSFTAPSSIIKPSGLKVSYTGGTEATVSWASDETAFDLEVNGEVIENVENPYTLTGLALGTTYSIRVRAKNASEVSAWTNAVSFTTDFPAQTLPYEEGFEGDIAAWTLVDCEAATGAVSSSSHGGSKVFAFKYTTTPPDYLISPEFEGTSAMTVSFWYKVQSGNYPETFQVGYSTTTKDVDAFTWGTEVTATNASEWLQYEVDFPAGTKFVAVRYNSNDKYYLFLDDFSFTVSTGVAKPTGLAASEIGAKTAVLSWTENGEATAWEISLNGDEENLISADSNPFTLTDLTPETEYTAKVRAVNGAKSNWSNEITFTTDVAFPAPTALAAAGITATSANITWTGTADSYNLRYRTAPESNAIVTDFEDSSLGEWTTIDADGDGKGWEIYSTGTSYLVDAPGTGYGREDSQDMIVSGSYSNNSGALTPDNFLVSPKVTLGGSISFWAKGQDASYAAEVFGVAVSTTSNTDPSAFTMVGADKTATGDWVQYTFDLGAFSGEGYVAIRHYNCTDMFVLDVDDIVISQPAGEGEPWTEVANVTSPYTIDGLTPETKYQVAVQAVYADGVSTWAQTSFTTAEDVPTPSELAVSEVGAKTAVLTWTENGEATAWEICLNDDEANLISADSNPFTLKGLTPTTDYTAKVRAVNGEKQSHWSKAVSFTTDIAFPAPAELAASNISSTSASISWTADATATGAELEYAEGNVFGSELRYDNGTFATNIGSSSEGTWTWGAMYPGSMVSASQLTKISIYETTYNTGDITINVYQGGDTAPGTLLYTETVTTEHANAFQDVTFASPVAITPGENLWITLTETGTYVMAACQTSESNNQWVLDESWSNIGDLASSLAAYGWMIRASISDDIDPSSVKWTAVADATSPYELTGLKPETTYTVRVKSIFGEEGESEWTSTAFTTAEDNPVPSNVEADLAADGTTLTWDGNGDSYNVRYRTASTKETEFEANFDAGLDEWTIVTAGEGPGWIITDEVGINAATAYSWKDNVSYNADNWLISPAVELGGTVTFSVTTATSYPDSYEVLLSTTGTDISDFTTTLQAMAAATPGEVTIDLSEYSGTGHIAIHHVSSDCYLLVIYEFAIYGKEVPSGEWTEMAVNDATATLSGLATNNAYEYQVQSVKDGSATDWTEAAQFALLTLDNNSDNKGNIQKFHDMVAHVTLADRTIYTDGTWNTITLPFNLTPEQLAASPLAGADVRTLTSALTVSEESVTLNFTEEGAIETAWGQYYGGVPYIFKIDGTGTISNPEFAGVTIAKTLNPMTGSDATSGISITFEPTYAPINFTSDDTSILFVGADNKLVYPLAGASIGACRGYFDLTGVSAGEASGVKILTNLDDEDATGIAGISNVKESGEWYDLSGRKLAGKPAVKGIYVTEGRKVTVK